MLTSQTLTPRCILKRLITSCSHPVLFISPCMRRCVSPSRVCEVQWLPKTFCASQNLLPVSTQTVHVCLPLPSELFTPHGLQQSRASRKEIGNKEPTSCSGCQHSRQWRRKCLVTRGAQRSLLSQLSINLSLSALSTALSVFVVGLLRFDQSFLVIVSQWVWSLQSKSSLQMLSLHISRDL